MSRPKKKDPQGKRVYRWQWAWFDWNRQTLSLDEARGIIKKACEAWDIHPPRIIGLRRNGADSSIYDDGNLSLRMLRSHLNPATVLHEVAHHIVHVRYGTNPQDHGPEWLGVFVDLLVAFKVAPEDALVASLKSRGLKLQLPLGRMKLE